MALPVPQKLQEFVAHTSSVNCVRFGRKSGLVFATGGDDRKVNLWRVGKPTNILSLAGHTTPVECVAFCPDEESVVAGSQAGSIRLFELGEGKTARTLAGHRSNCVCADFHPYGKFLASGGVDTQVKVRRRLRAGP
jgi:katanin p80 WD40 repeat-containing subunit B1